MLTGLLVPRLQAFAQVPDVRVYYGPDTYMGRNLATMLAAIARLPDEEVGPGPGV